MDALKETADEGIAGTVGDGIALLFGDTVRRRLWTRADYAHIHAVSGAYFMVLGFCGYLRPTLCWRWILPHPCPGTSTSRSKRPLS